MLFPKRDLSRFVVGSKEHLTLYWGSGCYAAPPNNLRVTIVEQVSKPCAPADMISVVVGIAQKPVRLGKASFSLEQTAPLSMGNSSPLLLASCGMRPQKDEIDRSLPDLSERMIRQEVSRSSIKSGVQA